MITNSDITIYHKTVNEQTRLEEYAKKYYSKCWKFGGKGSYRNKGYENANDIDIRVPYDENSNANIKDLAIGDIIFIGNGPDTIELQTDLTGEVYNITSLINNTYGNNPHIHIGGK